MRLCILVPGLPPVYKGGTEIATTYIAKYAAKEGHEVHVIALDGTNQGKELYQSKDGYIVHRVKTVSIPYLYGICGILGIVLRAWKIKPDVIHAQGELIGFSAFVTYMITGIPYILYGRGEIYVNWFMKKVITKLLMKYALRVIAQTEHMKKELLKYYDRDIEVIPNGIEVERFGNMSKEEARKILRYPQDCKILLAVGQCRPEKNYISLINVMKRINADIVTIVVGGGSQLDYLRTEAQKSGKCIMFVGNVDNSKIPIYMAAADCFINVSTSEGFPNAVLEALASGLPVIATDVTGMKEIITDSVNGFITKPNCPYLTLIGLRMMLWQRNTHEIAIENKKKALEYSWQNVVTKLYN